MSCVNCFCDQEYCYSFYEDSYLPSECHGCHMPIVLAANADLKKGTPLTLGNDGKYYPFNPAATPPQRFAGILMRDVKTDDNSRVIIGGLVPMPGPTETQMWISGVFDIARMDITNDQLLAIESQGRGYRVGGRLVLR